MNRLPISPRRGFTLVELLTALAVSATLISMAFTCLISASKAVKRCEEIGTRNDALTAAVLWGLSGRLRQGQDSGTYSLPVFYPRNVCIFTKKVVAASGNYYIACLLTQASYISGYAAAGANTTLTFSRNSEFSVEQRITAFDPSTLSTQPAAEDQQVISKISSSRTIVLKGALGVTPTTTWIGGRSDRFFIPLMGNQN